jgi:heavy metal sensor kinase
MDILIQVFDTDGATIASSKAARGLVEISRADFLSVLQGNSRFDTVSSDLPSGRLLLRIFTTPVLENEKVAYIVQVASPLDPVQVALKNLRFALFLLLPITVIATGVMGSLLAKAALYPVNSMIGTIHQITAENMKLKISIPDTKDEIQKLAETFNDMLGRLERAFVSERQLFADLSHELKTPLTILKGEFEVILKKVRTGEEYENTLRSSLEEINRIIKLVENLLILAKLDSKEAEGLERKNLDLGLLVQGAVNNVKGLSGLKDISMAFKPKDGLSVNADEDQLKTLFLNLLDNAIKYTEKGGKVSVSASKEGRMAKIEIKDTGVGIPSGELKHIFDRFYRGDKSRNRLGFGLGLSIAKSIAEAHGGNITVTSRLTKGTAFTVYLPLFS